MTSLALILQSDMSNQQVEQVTTAMAGLMGIIFFIGALVLAFMIFLFWRILAKAGLSGPLSLLLLIWPIGLVVVACILAFSDWKVIPITQVVAYPPSYPPAYPPQAPPAA